MQNGKIPRGRLVFCLSFIGTAIIGSYLILRSPADIREFRAIRDDWEQVVFGKPLVQFALSAKHDAGPMEGEERSRAIELLAKRCLKLAEKRPNSIGSLAALYLVVTRGKETSSEACAAENLQHFIRESELGDIICAIRETRISSGNIDSAIISAILERIERSPEDPQAAELAAWACAMASGNASASRLFSKGADIIKRRYTSSPGIVNFCETLGHGFGSPGWAASYEGHLREIIKKNQHRHVRVAALFALASVVQSRGETRQSEAEVLYQRFIDEFDGQFEYPYKAVEKRLHDSAINQLDELKYRAIGGVAPEIAGVDLNGVQMRLSDFRGKVVLLSFWATWCPPCMEFIPCEKSIAHRFRSDPFAIVGVNGDRESTVALQASIAKGISWRSFRDKAKEDATISKDWKILGWPTIYLIDHNGIIRKRWVDTPLDNELTEAIDQLVRVAAARNTTDASS